MFSIIVSDFYQHWQSKENVLITIELTISLRGAFYQQRFSKLALGLEAMPN